jgi:hypothetical protein
MMPQRTCPFCKKSTSNSCEHLALAVEGREFVRSCVEKCHAERPWQSYCARSREQQRLGGDWCPEYEDFTWLETAFCDAFLKQLTWFGSLDYEWRSGPKEREGGFWVLLWSKDPRRLWWELRDEIERRLSRLERTVTPRL